MVAKVGWRRKSTSIQDEVDQGVAQIRLNFYCDKVAEMFILFVDQADLSYLVSSNCSLPAALYSHTIL